MKFSLIKEMTKTVLNSANEYSEDDFFTSGIKNAQRNYYETKKMYTAITFVLVVLCIVIMLIKFLVF